MKKKNISSSCGNEVKLLHDIKCERSKIMKLNTSIFNSIIKQLCILEFQLFKILEQSNNFDDKTNLKVLCRVELYNYVNDLANAIEGYSYNREENFSICKSIMLPKSLKKALKSRDIPIYDEKI